MGVVCKENNLSSYKKCRVENKYILTFRFPISSIRAPTWPEKFPQKPVEISLRHINFSTCFVKQWFFGAFSHEKRGENPLFMGSLLFASTKIIHLPPKSKLIYHIATVFEMLKDEFCTPEAPPCIILRGAHRKLTFLGRRRSADG